MSGPIDDEVLLARAYLSRVSEPANLDVWALVRDTGPVQAARAIRAGRVPDPVHAATESRRAGDPEADLEAAARCGLRLVTPECDDWPHFALSALEHTGAQLWARARKRDAAQAREPATTPGTEQRRTGALVPPLALWARGPLELAPLGVRSVGIVGARAATPYGVQVSSELAFGLATAGVVVVSGGAYGIDAAAHRAALAAGGSTVLVSAGGLDRPYPPGNASLFTRVGEAGLLLSESPPGCAPQRHRFLSRNRLIAALATGTVVVEAAKRSGARNTAGHCQALQRPLMAVPGPITSPMSVGCHQLINGLGASLVGSVAEVLSVVGGIGETMAGADGELAADGGDVRAALDDLDPVARQVFEGLPARRFARPDEIAVRSGVPPLEVIRALPTLELAGLAEVGDAGSRVAVRPRRPAPAG